MQWNSLTWGTINPLETSLMSWLPLLGRGRVWSGSVDSSGWDIHGCLELFISPCITLVFSESCSPENSTYCWTSHMLPVKSHIGCTFPAFSLKCSRRHLSKGYFFLNQSLIHKWVIFRRNRRCLGLLSFSRNSALSHSQHQLRMQTLYVIKPLLSFSKDNRE